jgi:crotonobetainyl-CoA:carnitine CoA-transferase CaiB-like acyl-CoA transferase
VTVDALHEAEDVRRPLAGLRVLDLTQVVSGAFTTMLLADFGAEVIKVEPPSGEPYRINGYEIENELGSINLNILRYSRGKKSVVIDLKSDDGKQLFRRLVEESDILVENFRAGVLARLGFGRPELESINPTFAGTLLALLDRQAGDRGRRVDIAMYDGAVLMNDLAVTLQTVIGETLGPGQYLLQSPWGPFEVSDGHIVIAVMTGAQWRATCEVIGRPDLAVDDRLQTGFDLRGCRRLPTGPCSEHAGGRLRTGARAGATGGKPDQTRRPSGRRGGDPRAATRGAHSHGPAGRPGVVRAGDSEPGGRGHCGLSTM